MVSNDKSTGTSETGNNDEAREVPDAQAIKDARDARDPADKAPDGSAREEDVDDVHRTFLTREEQPDKAPFTMPGGRAEGVPEQDQ